VTPGVVVDGRWVVVGVVVEAVAVDGSWPAVVAMGTEAVCGRWVVTIDPAVVDALVVVVVVISDLAMQSLV
jgi:hypothetical protein